MLLGESGQHPQQVLTALRVDHAGDLVGHQQRGVAGQGRGHRQALQLATGERGGAVLRHPFQADLTQQTVDVDLVVGGQTPHDVVGDLGAQYLTFRVLHDDCGAADGTQAHRARPLDLT
ncbi:Uncharacterised protein [Mycobacteroides abscessus]|nr:Uncharacterised protein [Mycobacteroides abscessus]